MKVALKVPHSIKYEGAVGIHHERNFNKRLINEVASVLNAHGHDAKVIEINNPSLSDEGHTKEAARIANEWKADIFLDLHSNAFSDETANGSECWCYDTSSTKAINFSQRLLANLAGKGFRNRGVKYNNKYWSLKYPVAQAVIVESHFVTNRADCARMDALSWEALARCYANALDSNISLTAPAPTPTPTPTPPTNEKTLYRVCVGSFSDYDNAKKLEAQMKEAGHSAFIAIYKQ